MKLFLSILFSIFYFSSQAQIQIQKPEKKVTVGTAKQGMYLHSELSYKIDDDSDTIYTILYKNAEYERITDFKSVSFASEGNTLNELYNILKSVFLEENRKNKDYKINFKLGDTDVIVSTYRIMGTTGAWFYTSKGHTVFSEKQIEKLFGKD